MRGGRLKLMDIKFEKIIDKAQIEKLADLAKEIWREYYPEIIGMEQVNYMIQEFQSAEAIAEQITDEGYQYFMLICDGEALGYLGLKEDKEKLFLSKLYLKQDCRGKGYFNIMLSFIEHFARKRNLRSLYLTVNKENGDAIAVYGKKGFVIAKEQTTDIGRGFKMDDYVMEKCI